MLKIENSHIQKLLTHYKKISLLGKVKATMDWDLNVNMPPKASPGRAEQSAFLEGLMTDLWLEKEFLSALEKANGENDLSAQEHAIVRNLNRAIKFYTKAPKELIIENAQVTSEAFIHWREAREKNIYKEFLPHLKKIIAIDQKIAEHLGFKENLYDALLDLYEPELTASFTKKTFDALKDELVPLVQKIQTSKNYHEDSPLLKNRHYPKPEQEKLLQFVMAKMGYDTNAGRLDIAPHPFTTTLDRYDIRVTTKYNEEDFRESFTATTHELGHALYEQGVNPDYSDTSLEGGVSFGIHEAMSRFWENMVGKNPAYLRFLTPIFQSSYPTQLGKTTEEEFVRLFNMVKPSFIRIEADEVTYSLHIILRFEMEDDLLNGRITPEDAPEVWREKSKKYFGISPEKDSDGVLQDVHWTYGNFGYFPSYALGNLYGAQFFQKMKETVKFEETLGKGNLMPVKDWLDTNIHTHGSLYYPRELTEKVTGKPLNPTYFVQYLKDKYSKIYSL